MIAKELRQKLGRDFVNLNLFAKKSWWTKFWVHSTVFRVSFSFSDQIWNPELWHNQKEHQNRKISLSIKQIYNFQTWMKAASSTTTDRILTDAELQGKYITTGSLIKFSSLYGKIFSYKDEKTGKIYNEYVALINRLWKTFL